jgi:SNF2 family DNA or RNA helicase
MEFIAGIIEDNLLGLIIRPFLIRKPKDKGFYPIEAQISEYNISKYENNLTEHQLRIFQISQEYSESNLFSIFKTKKQNNTKEFITKLTKDEADKKIRPFIERRLVKIIDILRETGTELYFRDKHKFINRDNKVHVFKNPAQTVFNIIKSTNETRYYLSIKQDDKEINLLDKPYSIITNEPCKIIINNRLYSFTDIDAKKLLPFFKKEYIQVPKNFEKKWFQSFALPNIKKHKVNPMGFNIKKITPEKKAILSLEEDLSSNPVLLLKFQYGDSVFYANQGDAIKVDLLTENETFHFIKIERDLEWERSKINLLQNTGLKNHHLSYFKPGEDLKNQIKQSNKLYELIGFITREKNLLNDYGFQIEQNYFDKTYSFASFTLSAKTEEYEDWFDIRAEVKINGFSISFVKLRKYILQGIHEYPLPDGTYAVLPEEWFEKYPDLFKLGKIEKDRLLINKHHFRILEESFDAIDKNYFKRLEELTGAFDPKEIHPPQKLASTLRPYQMEGYQWMYLLQMHHFGGCLADDMGLGKTLQTLSLLIKTKQEVPKMEVETQQLNQLKQLSLFEQDNHEKKTHSQTMEVTPTFLIVMPTSLIYNWQNEIKKFTPELSIYKHTGMNRTTHPLELYKYDVILTTYGVVRNDYELLKKVYFYYIILDESQYIKNPSSKIYKAVNELRSKHKLVLTGTPIENSLSDLWAQLNFLNKGLLGSYNFFRNEFLLPIEKYKDDKKEQKLRSIINPFILRRTKNQVAKELPEKMEQVIYCEMTDEQHSYYEREKSMIRNNIMEQIEGNSENPTIHILDALGKLRQAANHPSMSDSEYSGSSGKFIEITDYLNSLISEGHKVLIFSSYKKHLRLVENYINDTGWNYSILTGETQNRQQQVETFQNDESNQVFLIQIKAGGFGLNLTAADYVMILDPWWNPAVEEQAVNRAHRIGQYKKVMVYRFISVDTVEEKIQKLQAKKAELAETFITAQETMRNLSREEIMALFE